MGNSNIGTLILYKQHYRDNYNNEASLPENQLFSTFGYYDGFKIIQEESNNTLKANCRVVFEGYVDDDEIMMCDNIVNAMEKTEIERADVRKLKRSMVN